MTRSVGGTSLMLVGAMCWLLLPGCSSKSPEPTEDAGLVRLRTVGLAYRIHFFHFNRPPRSERDLRRTFTELGVQGAEPDLEEQLRSPRDGQPYVVIYGVPLDSDYRSTVLAYEQNGSGGSRYVFTQSGDIKLLADAEFARADFAKGQRPAKKGP
jgi:hypothetical protein